MFEISLLLNLSLLLLGIPLIQILIAIFSALLMTVLPCLHVLLL